MKLVRLFPLLLCFLLFGSCERTYQGAAEMEVDFSWNSTKDAGKISPEIKINKIPKGTRQFLVEIADLDCSICNHGSGYIEYTGVSIIKTGAVKGSYVGPRPPPEKVHTYEISVKALDEKEQVIGFGKRARKYPSVK